MVSQDGQVTVRPSEPELNCVPINCKLLQLAAGASVPIELTAFSDERFFAVSAHPTQTIRDVGLIPSLVSGLYSSQALYIHVCSSSLQGGDFISASIGLAV